MQIIAMLIGVLLITIGVGGYAYAFNKDGSASPTALIPAAVGLLIAVLGALGINQRLRPHMMHAAVGIALIGLLGVASTLAIRNYTNLANLFAGGEVANPVALISQLLTAVLCLIFVLLGVRSFANARAARRRQTRRNALRT